MFTVINHSLMSLFTILQFSLFYYIGLARTLNVVLNWHGDREHVFQRKNFKVFVDFVGVVSILYLICKKIILNIISNMK